MNTKHATVPIQGREVLAKQTTHGLRPYHFANLTQALAAAAKAGGCAFRFPGGRPFYVWIRSTIEEPRPKGEA